MANTIYWNNKCQSQINNKVWEFLIFDNSWFHFRTYPYYNNYRVSAHVAFSELILFWDSYNVPRMWGKESLLRSCMVCVHIEKPVLFGRNYEKSFVFFIFSFLILINVSLILNIKLINLIFRKKLLELFQMATQ